ncbi:MAG: 16S rRNA (uracil(1498)-N(3))-methyltransferase [Clostridia bacterium]|nr:16S rRNA (uracil(1498)-N(3))-methyltransferase [Clostridia bacterium]
MSRFFTDPSNVKDKYIYLDNEGDIHHLKKVLRLRPGDEVDVSDGQKWEYHGKIEEIDQVAVIKILDKQAFAREPELKVTLFQGIPKASKMETIIQKNVEEGIYSIVPVFMDRTVVVDKGNFSKKLDRWQKIADEAVKQCKRGIIPKVEKDVKLDEAIKMLSDFDLVLFPYENEEDVTIKDCLKDMEKPRTVAIVIGPEGGFSQGEVDKLLAIGAKSVSLGKTILRTETAGLVALAMTMYQFEL